MIQERRWHYNITEPILRALLHCCVPQGNNGAGHKHASLESKSVAAPERISCRKRAISFVYNATAVSTDYSAQHTMSNAFFTVCRRRKINLRSREQLPSSHERERRRKRPPHVEDKARPHGQLSTTSLIGAAVISFIL